MTLGDGGNATEHYYPGHATFRGAKALLRDGGRCPRRRVQGRVIQIGSGSQGLVEGAAFNQQIVWGPGGCDLVPVGRRGTRACGEGYGAPVRVENRSLSLSGGRDAARIDRSAIYVQPGRAGQRGSAGGDEQPFRLRVLCDRRPGVSSQGFWRPGTGGVVAGAPPPPGYWRGSPSGWGKRLVGRIALIAHRLETGATLDTGWKPVPHSTPVGNRCHTGRCQTPVGNRCHTKDRLENGVTQISGWKPVKHCQIPDTGWKPVPHTRPVGNRCHTKDRLENGDISRGGRGE